MRVLYIQNKTTKNFQGKVVQITILHCNLESNKTKTTLKNERYQARKGTEK